MHWRWGDDRGAAVAMPDWAPWVLVIVLGFAFRRRIFATARRAIPAIALLVAFGWLASAGYLDQLVTKIG